MEKLVVCCLLFVSLAGVKAVYVKIDGACIQDHNTINVRGESRTWCQRQCDEDDTCKSYEYRPDRKVCHTSPLDSSSSYFRSPCHVTGYDLYDRKSSTFCPDGPLLDITSSPYLLPTTGWNEIWNKGVEHSCKIQGVWQLTPPAGKAAVQIDLTFDGPFGQTVFDIAGSPTTYGFRTNICGDVPEVWGFHDSFEICLGGTVLALDRDETLREKFTIQLATGKMAVSNHHDWNESYDDDLFEIDASNSLWFGVNHATDDGINKWGDGLCAVCVSWYDSWEDLPGLPPM